MTYQIKISVYISWSR